ncbi:MAG TPA: hypothetical protein VFO60_11545 [Candidatus Dormibacteraeota bacterium]|nr:hypothetical protein [Candidatus Dormibacteraeota bacterium]
MALCSGWLLAACSPSTTPDARSTSGVASTPPVAGSSLATAAPATAAPATPGPLRSCPPPVTLADLTPLDRLPYDLDDVTVDAGGDLWFTAVNAGFVFEDDARGHRLRVITDTNGPEGIVPLPGEAFALAEQTANRVVRLEPALDVRTPLLAVPNRTPNEGVDGLAFDTARSRLLVPDSANGRLLALPVTPAGAAAGPVQVLATGLGRPVAAWPEADGGVDVGVENPPGLLRLPAGGGTARALVPSGVLKQVDEVVGVGGLLYVTDLQRRELDAVDPGSGRVVPLVTGAPDPQGLTLLPGGRLLLVDSSAGVLATVSPC